MTKISICIPTYNRAKFLQETLDSVTNQNYDDFEILVVDNASTDNTEEIVELFKKSYSKVRYEKNPMNVGYSKNLERCLQLSKGNYLIFLADDDLFINGIIKKYVEIFDSDDKIGVIVCNIYQINIDGTLDYIMENFTEDKIFQNGEEALENMIHSFGALSGIGIRKLSWMNNYRINSLLYPQTEIGAKVLTTHNGYALVQPMIALKIHKIENSCRTNMFIEHLKENDKKNYITVDIKMIFKCLNIKCNRRITKKLLNYWLLTFPSEIIICGKTSAMTSLKLSLMSHKYLILNINFWLYGVSVLIMPKWLLVRLRGIYKKFMLKHRYKYFHKSYNNYKN